MCKKMQFIAGNHRRCQVVQFRYNIVNFDKKISVPNEIPSEAKVSIVKKIVIMRVDCMQEKESKMDVWCKQKTLSLRINVRIHSTQPRDAKQ